MAKKTETRAAILSDAEIRSKFTRMAYEIYESNYVYKKITIVGLGAQGEFIARALKNQIEEISSIKVDLVSAVKDIANSKINLDIPAPGKIFKDRNVVIVDDVLYSGKTLFSAVALVLAYMPVRIQTAVLIDRGHRLLPISPNFTGIELATTLREHVSVEFNLKTGKAAAFLD